MSPESPDPSFTERQLRRQEKEDSEVSDETTVRLREVGIVDMLAHFMELNKTGNLFRPLVDVESARFGVIIDESSTLEIRGWWDVTDPSFAAHYPDARVDYRWSLSGTSFEGFLLGNDPRFQLTSDQSAIINELIVPLD